MSNRSKIYYSVFFCLTFMMQNHAFAELNCQEPQSSEIKEVADDVFRFTVEIQCQFPQNEASESATEIMNIFAERARSHAEEIKSEKSIDKGLTMETINTYEDGNDFIKLANTYIFKTNHENYAGYTRTSTEILKSSGYSKYTQRIFAGSGVMLKDGKIRIKSKQVFDIKKPLFAPESFFKKEVGKVIVKSTKVLIKADTEILGAK